MYLISPNSSLVYIDFNKGSICQLTSDKNGAACQNTKKWSDQNKEKGHVWTLQIN